MHQMHFIQLEYNPIDLDTFYKHFKAFKLKKK